MVSDRETIPKAIIFFGPDGSGKTTQADLLVKEINNRGIKTRKVWLRSLHTLAFIISAAAMRCLSLENVYQFRTKYSHARGFKPIWYLIEFVSILPLILYKFYLPISRGYVIVAERFVIDWIVTLAYATRNESLMDSMLAKMVLKFIPSNSLLVFVDASYDAITSRGRTEDAIDFIQFQRQSYKNFAIQLSAFVIDTSNKTVDEVHNSILQRAYNVSCQNE